MTYRGASKLLLPTVLLCARAAAAQDVGTRADDLRQYTDCNFGEKLTIEEIDERPAFRALAQRHGARRTTTVVFRPSAMRRIAVC